MNGLILTILLIVLSLGTAVSVIFYSQSYLESITNFGAKATIIAAVVTLLGTVFTGMITQLSSYYKDKRIASEKKWELIFPFVKQYYSPWLNSAKSLQESLDTFLSGKKSEIKLTRVLYLIMVFYTYRLKLVIQGGAIILLTTTKEEKKVDEAYRLVLKNFSWAGDETPKKVSELQGLLLKKDKLDDPYTLYKFEGDIANIASINESRVLLKNWLESNENIGKVNISIKKFIDTLEESIDNLHDLLNL